MIHRKETYEKIKKQFALKSLSQKQVEGFEAIFDEFEKEKLTDNRYLAYILATVWHEVGGTMQPIEEIGKGKNYKYGKRVWIDGRIYTDVPHIYYGRGHVQNTWRDNYLKLTKSNTSNWDFINKPELLLQMQPSIWATFYGMLTGLYTGKKLSNYFNDKISDPVNARRIINGTDKAQLIAGYYTKFLNSIS